MSNPSTSPLVWIDCEMTGLDHESDTIMSIAVFITDHNLNLVDSQGYEASITHTSAQMNAMGQWCRDTHAKSGLLQTCLDSSKSISAEQAANEVLRYIKRYIPDSRSGLLAGNSVHCDKMFLAKMPWKVLLDHLHYRILDVSSIKEAARRWAPDALRELPRKEGKHEARADILESIEEARFYKSVFF